MTFARSPSLKSIYPINKMSLYCAKDASQKITVFGKNIKELKLDRLHAFKCKKSLSFNIRPTLLLFLSPLSKLLKILTTLIFQNRIKKKRCTNALVAKDSIYIV